MGLAQIDIVSGLAQHDRTWAKCFTGLDDHSQLRVSATMEHRELSLSALFALEHASPRSNMQGQIPTDN